MPIPWIAKTPLDRFLETMGKTPAEPVSTPKVSWVKPIEPLADATTAPTMAKEAILPIGQTDTMVKSPTSVLAEYNKQIAQQTAAEKLPSDIKYEMATSAEKDVAQAQAVDQSKPIWARALEMFAAPFEWIDNYVIKPGLATLLNPLIPNMEREVGENVWEQRKREWEEWKTPVIAKLDMPWGEWTIDLKGIVEQVPWLLVPGAGTAAKTVGGVVKAGTGIAGMLSKAGKIGKAAAKVVEYSPWGLVERGTSKAFGTAFKLVNEKSKQLGARIGSRFVGVSQPAQVAPEVAKLTKIFKELVVPARKRFEAALPKELRDRQEAIVKEIQDGVRSGRISAKDAPDLQKKALGAIDGIKEQYKVNVPQAPNQPIVGPVSPDALTVQDVDNLLKTVYDSAQHGLENMDTAEALQNLFRHGELPMPYQIKKMAEIYGDEFASAVSELGKAPNGVLAKALDILNIPRASLSSVDISATLRQGLILGLTHPTAAFKSFGRQLKAFASEKLALDMAAVRKADPLYQEFLQHGGYIAPLEKAAKWAAMEESFASKIAENIPMVRRSERGFITYLNELRFAAYKQARNAWVAQGAKEGELRLLADFINNASGRGELPRNLDKYAPLLNTFLFSPRLQMSRMELPVILGKMLFSDKPYMRKEAARALVTFLGGGTALLSLAKSAGAEVETDPRSADFAKIKIGDTRFDIWTGYAQYARFIAQFMTGEKKQAYGNMSKAERLDTASRFLQSKTSPAVGLLVDLLRGEDYLGKPLAKDTKGLIDTVKAKMMPLVLQDMMDAIEMDGMNPLALSTVAASSLGVGTLTYVNDFVKARNEVAQQLGYKTWSEIDPIKQREIEKLPRLQAAMLEYDRQSMGTAWGNWRLAGNAIEDAFTQEVELASEKYRLSGDGMQYREDIQDAYTARRGAYNARQKDEQFAEIVARFNSQSDPERAVKLGPEQMAIYAYEEALEGADMYDVFGDYRFDEAEIRKAQLKEALGEELYNYVVEYKGLRYEDLPPEFHELQKAKQVLKPYWDIQSEADKYFPKETRAKERFIARRRKVLRRLNKEVDYYLKLFYTREGV